MFNKIFIKYENNNIKEKIPENKIKTWMNKIFKKLKIKNCSISIYFTDDKNIKKLNKYYLNKNYPTDVLSFSQFEGRFFENKNIIKNLFLGDIVISVPYAQKSSFEKKHELITELYLLLLHGLMHIIGYDHENKNDDYMLQMQEKIFFNLTGVKIAL